MYKANTNRSKGKDSKYNNNRGLQYPTFNNKKIIHKKQKINKETVDLKNTVA